MRARALAVVLVALLFIGCGKRSWSEYSSDKGKFKVLMPGKPTQQTQRIITPVGPLDIHVSMVDKPDIAYMVAYIDYPRFVVEQADADELLDNARDGAFSKVEGRLLKEDRIVYDEYPGREMEFEAKGGLGLGRAVVVLADNRLYQVMAVGKKETFPPGDAKKFVDSFEIVK